MNARNVGLLAAVIGVVALVAFVVVRSGKGAREGFAEDAGFNPVTVDADILRPRPPPMPSAAPSDSPELLAALDAGLTPSEYRLSRQRLHPDLCPKAGEQQNKLAGKPPTDPYAVNIVARCLHMGNAAWYKCLLEAKDADEGNRCNARLLRPLD